MSAPINTYYAGAVARALHRHARSIGVSARGAAKWRHTTGLTASTRLAVDHALIVHDDLAACAAALARLGFRPTPVGYHGQSLGTANVTVMLPDRETYFEMIATVEATPHNAAKRAVLAAHGPHPFGLAFKGDARAAQTDFAAAGVAEGEAFDFEREVALAGGPARARFAIAQIAEGTLPGLYAFVCQQFTPDVVWRADHLEHPNGARALVGLWGVARDRAGTAAAWRRLFGAAVRETDGEVRIATPTAAVRYLPPAAFTARCGLPLPDRDPGLVVLELSVADIAATREHLAAVDVPVERMAGRLLVPDTLGLGAAFLFTAEGAAHDDR
jgi:hypothetical protein